MNPFMDSLEDIVCQLSQGLNFHEAFRCLGHAIIHTQPRRDESQSLNLHLNRLSDIGYMHGTSAMFAGRHVSFGCDWELSI